jgi:hypothetical protein
MDADLSSVPFIDLQAGSSPDSTIVITRGTKPKQFHNGAHCHKPQRAIYFDLNQLE